MAFFKAPKSGCSIAEIIAMLVFSSITSIATVFVLFTMFFSLGSDPMVVVIFFTPMVLASTFVVTTLVLSFLEKVTFSLYTFLPFSDMVNTFVTVLSPV